MPRSYMHHTQSTRHSAHGQLWPVQCAYWELTSRAVDVWSPSVALIIVCCLFAGEALNSTRIWRGCQKNQERRLFIYLFIFCFICFLLLYNTVLVLPYINKSPPRVYTCSQSWTPLPPPSRYHPSGSSQCTSPKHPVSCIEPGLAIRFLYDIIHVSMPFSQIIPPSPSPTESKSQTFGFQF